MTVHLVLAAEDVVGESLVWDDMRQRLAWVDIIRRRIHALDPTTEEHRVWLVSARPTSLALRADGGALLSMSDRDTGALLLGSALASILEASERQNRKPPVF